MGICGCSMADVIEDGQSILSKKIGGIAESK
jgi:hypothetical protein